MHEGVNLWKKVREFELHRLLNTAHGHFWASVYYTNILKLLLQIHENTVDLKFDQTKVILKIKTTTKIKKFGWKMTSDSPISVLCLNLKWPRRQRHLLLKRWTNVYDPPFQNWILLDRFNLKYGFGAKSSKNWCTQFTIVYVNRV